MKCGGGGGGVSAGAKKRHNGEQMQKTYQACGGGAGAMRRGETVRVVGCGGAARWGSVPVPERVWRKR